MNKRNISVDTVFRNVFEQKMGAFELLQIMEQEKHGLCLECRSPLKAPGTLVDTGRGHYMEGHVLCAFCVVDREARLSRELMGERNGNQK